jgi:glycosyltransferase involved in cell wall biosynthesis
MQEAGDLRRLWNRRERGQYLRWLARPSRQPPPYELVDGVRVQSRSTFAPGHRGSLALALDTRSMVHHLRPFDVDGAVVVAMAPWHWPAVAALKRARRVLDLGDDWARLIPARAGSLRELQHRAARQADSVIIASPDLAVFVSGSTPTIVRNGTSTDLVEMPVVPPPQANKLVYVGTMSERFDAPLLGAVLDRMPEWSLDLYGGCSYRLHGDRPSRELQNLLGRTDRRVTWHGIVGRSHVVDVLDQSDVLLIPNRDDETRGQDSMKLYDYAARGRPIVATSAATATWGPLPGVYTADGIDETVEAIRATSKHTVADSAQQQAWAKGNTWDQRWPEWWSAARGEGLG